MATHSLRVLTRKGTGRLRAIAAGGVMACCLAGCKPHEPPRSGEQRETLQALTTTFYRVHDGKQQWIELEIVPAGDKPFRMPVFFSDNGRFVQPGDTETASLLHRWLRQRAEMTAAAGSLDPQTGLTGPFLAIDRNNP